MTLMPKESVADQFGRVAAALEPRPGAFRGRHLLDAIKISAIGTLPGDCSMACGRCARVDGTAMALIKLLAVH